MILNMLKYTLLDISEAFQYVANGQRFFELKHGLLVSL